MIASAQPVFWPFAKSRPLFASRPILCAFSHTSLQGGVKCAAQTKVAVPAGMTRKKRLLHHTQYARSRWCIAQCTRLHCNNFEFTIHLMLVGLPSPALFQYLKRQGQRISERCRSTFIFSSSWNLWWGPFFTFSLPRGGRRAHLPLVSYATGMHSSVNITCLCFLSPIFSFHTTTNASTERLLQGW